MKIGTAPEKRKPVVPEPRRIGSPIQRTVPLPDEGHDRAEKKSAQEKGQEKTEEQLKKEQYEKELEKKKLEKKKGEKSSMTPEQKIEMSWSKIVEKGGENSAAVQFGKALKTGGTDQAMNVLKKLKQLEETGKTDVYFKEGEFNTLGYVFLYNKKVDEAITVFKVNVKMYPDSWNVYDSLGEGLLAAGKFDKSRKYYEKSIAMNPENENGKKMLAKIDELEKEEVAKKGI